MKRLSLLFALFISLSTMAHPQSFFMLVGTANGGGGGGGSTGVDTLASGTVASAATMDINMSTFYNQYRIITIYFYDIVPATSGSAFDMLYSSNGTTFDNATLNYDWTWSNLIGFSETSAGTSITNVIELIGGTGGSSPAGGLPNGSGQTTDGTLIIEHAANTGKQQDPWGFMHIPGASTLLSIGGRRLTNQALEGIRFKMATGNMSGSYVVVGVR